MAVDMQDVIGLHTRNYQQSTRVLDKLFVYTNLVQRLVNRGLNTKVHHRVGQ